MSETPKNVEVLELPISEILLDPNSYRLVDDIFWQPILDEDIDRPDVQARNFASVYETVLRTEDLRVSVYDHGPLDVAPIWVRQLSNKRFVAVDGNRRLAALQMRDKWLSKELALASEKRETAFSSIYKPAVKVYVLNDLGASRSSLAFALRHSILPLQWSPLGIALWNEGTQKTPSESGHAGRRKSSSPLEDSTIIRALSLARKFAAHWESNQNISLFYVFLEALNDRRISAWLSPDRGEMDETRVERILKWLLPSEIDHAADGIVLRNGQSREKGVFVRNVQIISRLLNSADAVAGLDAGAPIVALYDEMVIFRGISEPENYLHPWVDSQIAQNGPLDTAKVQQSRIRLEEALRRTKEEPVEAGTQHPWETLHAGKEVLLESLTIKAFRGLKDVSLSKFRRINLFVGVNNAGKTSVLEAIYLLSRLSDPRGLLDTLRIRTRQNPERDPSLLSNLIEDLTIDIEGTQAATGDLAAQNLKLFLSRLPRGPDTDEAQYIPGMLLAASVGDTPHTTSTELFNNRPRRTKRTAGTSHWLAPAVLHSPYFRPERDAIIKWYEATVEGGAIKQLIEALAEALDPALEDIRLVSESGRFLVSRKNSDQRLDISSYGEGLQRMFELSLLFAAHAGGFVLIDELETAMHPNALIRFTKLIQELADKFKVQTFITTHSKETIDAFIKNDYRTDDIAAYGLYRIAGELKTVRYSGRYLAKAIEAVDLDIRRS